MSLFRVAIVAIALIFSTLSAQAEIISFGLSAGSSNAIYSVDGRDGAVSNKSGFQAGFDMTIKVPIVSLSPELLYTNNKFRVTDPEIFGRTCDLRDQSIVVPVVVGVSLFGPLKLEGGPVFSIYNSARASYYSEKPATEDLGRIHSPMGYVAGVKVTILKKVVIGARFYGDVDHTTFGANGYQIRSHSYNLSIGYKL